MKYKNIRIVLYVLPGLLILLFAQCKDIIEEDLADQAVFMISPPDGDTTTVSTITFWWDYIDGADKYNLQVVSPSFNYVERLILDTNITGNKFQHSLTPGDYEWSVMGFNSASNSRFYIYSFVIDSIGDLAEQEVLLVSPINNDTTNVTSFTFEWDPLYNADEYRFEIWTPNFEGTRITQEYLQNSSVTYTFNQTGPFEWGVSAENEISKTLFSTRKLFIDTTAPQQPSLVQPANGAVLSDSLIEFSWNTVIDSGASITNHFYLYNDTVPGTPYIEISTKEQSYTDSLSAGFYSWKVIATDAAGNEGRESETWQFKVVEGK